jgi:hypothetical protein
MCGFVFGRVRELLLCILSCWPSGALYYRQVTLTASFILAVLSATPAHSLLDDG